MTTMPNAKERKVTGPLAAEVCHDVQLDKPARKLLRDEQTAEEFILTLIDAGYFNDATRVLARMLPQREAVWWACQSARQAPLPDAPPAVDVALSAAERWVTEMTEESRRAAGVAGQEAEIGTAAGCAAMAAATTGGSLASPETQPLPPPPQVPVQYVVGSILISALSPNPAQAPEKYRTFLSQGIDLYKATMNQ
jgi:hypothetical protein